MLVVEFKENEEFLFQQTFEWLSFILTTSSTFIKQTVNRFHLGPFTWAFTNDKRQNIYLTSKEFDLLHFLMLHKGQVFTKEQLHDNVCGYDYVSDAKNLTGFIRKLRIKIEPDPQSSKYILTVWDVGYKFSEENVGYAALTYNLRFCLFIIASYQSSFVSGPFAPYIFGYC